MEATRVGIAIVEHAGRFLVGVRGSDQVLSGQAEFPGGKCHDGEAASDCAVRECREETGIEVSAERLLDRTVHEYDHGRIALEFWLCHPVRSTTPQNGFRWASCTELATLPFPAANQRVVQHLLQELQ
ncbi:MAG: (deoxy)nucleoside triphosphate pyrophosphohydrolase [Planctomycetota bacterium]|jgi:mutator protein MutT